MMPPLANREAGMSIIEVIVAMAFLGAILLTVTNQISTVKKHLRGTQNIMALDALEASVLPLLADEDIIKISVAASGDAYLQKCFNDAGSTCETFNPAVASASNNQIPETSKYRPLTFRLAPDSEPLTGPEIYYDQNAAAQPSTKRQKGFQIHTYIYASCAPNANGCFFPDYVSIKYKIVATTNDGKPSRLLRVGYTEMLFPDHSRLDDSAAMQSQLFERLEPRSCPGPLYAIKGFTATKNPICASHFDVVSELRAATTEDLATDAEGRLNIEPVICPDGFHISGISAENQLACRRNFWESQQIGGGQ